MLATFAVVLALAAASDPDPIRVWVYAQQPDGGFVDKDSERRADSAKDLKRALEDEDGIELVDDRKRADVLLEVISSAMEATGERIGTRVPLFGRVSSESSDEVKDKTVRAVIRVGDYEHEVVGKTDGLRWRDAANDAAKQVKDWVKDNAEMVIAQR